MPSATSFDDMSNVLRLYFSDSVSCDLLIRGCFLTKIAPFPTSEWWEEMDASTDEEN